MDINNEKRIKLVVCNEPQNCGTVKELEAELQRLKPFEELYLTCKEERLQALQHVELLKKDSAMVGKLWVDDKVESTRRTEFAESRLTETEKKAEKWRSYPTTYDRRKCAEELESILKEEV